MGIEEIKNNPTSEKPTNSFDLEDYTEKYTNKLNEIKNLELTQTAKEMIYISLDINEITQENSTIKQFIKGILDSLILTNIEITEVIIDSNGKVIIDILSLILSWEGLKSIAEGLGQEISDLFSLNPYLTGKSIIDLGLISVGTGTIIGGVKEIGKNTIKTTAKETFESIELRIKEIGKTFKQAPIGTTSEGFSIPINDIDNIKTYNEMGWFSKGKQEKAPITKDKNKTDYLDNHTFRIDIDTPIKEATQKIEDYLGYFGIDFLDYLIDYPERILEVVETFKNHGNYIINNIDKIKKLSSRELEDFKKNFAMIRRNIDKIINNLNIDNDKMFYELEKLKNGEIAEAYGKLYPPKTKEK